MTERLHAALDGELPPEDLTPAERDARAAVEARVAGLRSDLDSRVPADMDVNVMRRIRDLGLEPLPEPATPLLKHLARSLWTERELRVRTRPVYGLAAAATLAALLLSGGALLLAPAPANPPAVAAAPAPIYVQFRLEAGAATDVALAGSFSDWQPTHHMQQTMDGVWTILLPLTPGVHDYGFVVDGEEWVADPYAPHVDDGFGGVNSRLTVLEPADRL